MLQPWEFPGCCKPIAAGLQLMLLKVIIMLWRYTRALGVHTHGFNSYSSTKHLCLSQRCSRAGLVVLPTCFGPSLSKACCWYTVIDPTGWHHAPGSLHSMNVPLVGTGQLSQANMFTLASTFLGRVWMLKRCICQPQQTYRWKSFQYRSGKLMN